MRLGTCVGHRPDGNMVGIPAFLSLSICFGDAEPERLKLSSAPVRVVLGCPGQLDAQERPIGGKLPTAGDHLLMQQEVLELSADHVPTGRPLVLHPCVFQRRRAAGLAEGVLQGERQVRVDGVAFEPDLGAADFKAVLGRAVCRVVVGDAARLKLKAGPEQVVRLGFAALDEEPDVIVPGEEIAGGLEHHAPLLGVLDDLIHLAATSALVWVCFASSCSTLAWSCLIWSRSSAGVGC